MDKKVRVVLDSRSLDMTPCQFVKKNELTVSSPVVECVRHDKDPLSITIRFDPDRSTYRPHVLLEWRLQQEFDPIYRVLDTPFARIKTFRCFFEELQSILSERENEEKTRTVKESVERDEFRTLYGRPRYPDEPKMGFRSNFFRPTATDDGTVVINGRIFLGPDRKFGELIFNDAFIYENERDLTYLRSLTREEFKERYQYPIETRRNVSVIEQYFEKKLEPKVIEKIYESLGTHYQVLNDLHPKTGSPCLLIVVENGFWECFPKKDEENCFVVGATSKKEYASFVGKALLGGLLTQGIRENKNDRER